MTEREKLIKCMICECDRYQQTQPPSIKCECGHPALQHRILNPPEASGA
jgi:hypothetical protein